MKYFQLRGILRTRFSSFIKENKKKQCSNLSLICPLNRNCSILRLSSKTHGYKKWIRNQVFFSQKFKQTNKKTSSQRKKMFELIINLSLKNCSISRLSSQTHGYNKVEERKKKSTVAFRSDIMATHWIWDEPRFRSFLYQITGDLFICDHG